MASDTLDKATRFREPHHRAGAFLMPNPWNAGTARLLAATAVAVPVSGDLEVGFGAAPEAPAEINAFFASNGRRGGIDQDADSAAKKA